MSLLKNKYTQRVSYVMISQVLALLVSALLILILPKYVSVQDYGYWQLFILYSGYVGLFHFGYSDGLYIKAGGKNLKDLNSKSLSGQFNIFVVIQFFISAVIAFTALKSGVNSEKQFIFIAIAVYLIVENIHKLLSFLLLATDESIIFSKSVLIDKLLVSCYLVVLVLIKESSFTTVVVVFIFARLLSLAYLIWHLRSFWRLGFGFSELSNAIRGIWDNCSLGIVLTVSNILGALILATGRLFVEYFWSLEAFAKISLAISLSMFILALISQLSLVLYPTLRNMDFDKQKDLLQNGSVLLGYFSVLSFGLYFFVYVFINYWLPDYAESLNYLVYLFPIILFEVKTQVLYTTYCKSLKRLKLLLVINVITLLFAVVMYCIAGLSGNIDLILMTMLFSLMLRSVLLNIYLYRSFGLKLDKYFILEIIFALFFIVINELVGFGGLLIYYVSMLIGVQLLYGKRMRLILKGLRQ